MAGEPVYLRDVADVVQAPRELSELDGRIRKAVLAVLRQATWRLE